MTVEIIALPNPDQPDTPPVPLLVAFAEVARRDLAAVLGDDDLADSPEQMSAALANQTYADKRLLLALDAGRVVGGLWLHLPTRDNLSNANGSFSIDPGADVTEVTSALWAVALPLLADLGRSRLHLWSAHDPAGQEHVMPPTGMGPVPLDARTKALLALGLRLEQSERHSVAELATSLDLAAAELPGARQAAGTAYRTFSWVGPTPEEHLEAMAALMMRMSTDVPMGGLELEAEVWDAQRVAVGDERAMAQGRTRVTTVAQEVATGDLVAYTFVDVRKERPQVAFQEDTLVHADHRGHRLGLLVKALNLQCVAEHAPQVQRLHTWNATENAHMLAINEALGYTARSVEGAWQITGITGTGG